MNKYSNLPLVSVCIPVYGRADLLPLCLNSIVHQSYTNLEIIIIYTKYNDNSLDICNSYKNKDPRIKIIDLETEMNIKGPNLSKSTELGYNIAVGKYLCTVDSDDYIEHTCIEQCVNNIGNKGLIYTYCRQFGDLHTLDNRAFYPYSKDKLLEFFMVFHFRLFIKEAWDQIGELNNVQYCLDYDLVLRLSEVTDFILLPKPLYYWRRHNNQQASKDNLNLIKECRLLSISNALKRRGLFN